MRLMLLLLLLVVGRLITDPRLCLRSPFCTLDHDVWFLLTDLNPSSPDGQVLDRTSERNPSEEEFLDEDVPGDGVSRGTTQGTAEDPHQLTTSHLSDVSSCTVQGLLFGFLEEGMEGPHREEARDEAPNV